MQEFLLLERIKIKNESVLGVLLTVYALQVNERQPKYVFNAKLTLTVTKSNIVKIKKKCSPFRAYISHLTGLGGTEKGCALDRIFQNLTSSVNLC